MELLATGYRQTSREEESLQVRLDAADRYLEQGRAADAQRVLEPVEGSLSTAPEAERRRYETLIRAHPEARAVEDAGATERLRRTGEEVERYPDGKTVKGAATRATSGGGSGG